MEISPFRVTGLGTRMTGLMVLLVLVALGAQVTRGQEDAAPEYAVKAPLASRSLMLDAAAADGALVAVGGRGHILISEDAGETWTQAEVPTRAALTGVFFHDRNLGWVVGHDSVILRTTDGGGTWERVHWAPEEESPFFDIWFADADNGFAIGAYGSFYVTTDGGSTWSFEPVGEYDYHLHHLARAADGRLYMAAEAGMIYRSEDGGETWIELYSPYSGSYFGTLPLDGDTLLLYGLRGHLYRSEDAGESWTELETGTVAMLTDGLRLDDGRILLTGLGGVTLISEDGGHTFDLLQQSNRRGISAVVKVSEDSLLLVGEFGVRTLPLDDLTSRKER